MTFGLPAASSDQPTFYLFGQVTPTVPVDQQGVPYDPDETISNPPTSVHVPCAVEYIDRAGKIELLGLVAPSQLKLTLLDADYQKVEGFAYVVIAGRKYLYRRTEAPIALGTVDVWTVHCEAEDSA